MPCEQRIRIQNHHYFREADKCLSSFYPADRLLYLQQTDRQCANIGRYTNISRIKSRHDDVIK